MPSGYMSFEEVKNNMLTPLVLLEKKLDMLKSQAEDLRSKISGNDLNSIKSINPNISIQRADTMTVSIPSPLIGTDHNFNFIVFKMTAGQISDPIRTQRGYFIVQMKNITSFDQAKYNQESDKLRTDLLAQRKQSFFQEWLADLKDKSVIVNRDRFGR
jgi:hypothetical protein